MENKWILADGNALNGKNVLCVNSRGKMAIGQLRFYTNPKIRFVCYKSSRIILENITHYIPLPEPPKS